MAKFGFGSWEAGQTIPFEVGSFLFLVRKTVGKDRYSWYVRSLEHLIPAPLAKASAARRDDLPVLTCCRCSLAGQLSWFVRDSAKFGRRECVRARQPATHQQASRPASLASNQPAGWCQPTCPPAPPPNQPANASHTTASSWRPLTSRHPPCRPVAGADCVLACLHVGVWHSGVLGPRDRAARRRSGDGRRLRRLQQ